jgi:hypothetical protein
MRKFELRESQESYYATFYMCHISRHKTQNNDMDKNMY